MFFTGHMTIQKKTPCLVSFVGKVSGQWVVKLRERNYFFKIHLWLVSASDYYRASILTWATRKPDKIYETTFSDIETISRARLWSLRKGKQMKPAISLNFCLQKMAWGGRSPASAWELAELKRQTSAFRKAEAARICRMEYWRGAIYAEKHS